MEENLEKRIKNFENLVRKSPPVKITDLITNHPILFSPLGSFTTIFLRILDEVMNKIPHSGEITDLSDTAFLGLYPGYKILKTFGEYVHKEKDLFRTRGLETSTRIYNWFLDNENLVASVIGTGFTQIDQIMGIKIKTLNDQLIVGSLAAITTTGILGLNKYLQSLRKRKEETKLEKIITNPLTYASSIALYRGIETYNIFRNGGFTFEPGKTGDISKGMYYVTINALSTFVAVEFIGSMIKALVQKETKEEIKLFLEQTKNKINKNRRKVIKIQEERIEKSISKEGRIRKLSELSKLAKRYYRKTKENYFKEIWERASANAAIEIFNERDGESSHEFLKRKSGLELILKSSRGLVEGNLPAAMNCIAEKRWEKAECYLRRELETNPTITTKYLRARVLQKINKKEADEELRRIIKEVIAKEGIEVEETESKNKIYKIKNQILKNDIIIKESKDPNQEYEVAELLKSRFKNIRVVDTAQPIAVVDNFYIMEMVPHPTFADIIDKSNDDEIKIHLERLSEILAAVHLTTREIKPQEGERDLESSIKKELWGYADEPTYERLTSNLKPLILYQKNIERVGKKDPHPWNFLIDTETYNYDEGSKGRYIIIDTEVAEPIPIVTEWAIFLFHKELFKKGDFNKKVEFLKDRIIPLNIEAKLISNDPENYMLGVYNSTISRTLELQRRLSCKKDKSKYRKDLLESSLQCIDRIKEGFSFSYRRFNDQYKNLEEGVNSLLLKTNI